VTCDQINIPPRPSSSHSSGSRYSVSRQLGSTHANTYATIEHFGGRPNRVADDRTALRSRSMQDYSTHDSLRSVPVTVHAGGGSLRRTHSALSAHLKLTGQLHSARPCVRPCPHPPPHPQSAPSPRGGCCPSVRRLLAVWPSISTLCDNLGRLGRVNRQPIGLVCNGTRQLAACTQPAGGRRAGGIGTAYHGGSSSTNARRRGGSTV
jgi:hypothetical protein